MKFSTRICVVVIAGCIFLLVMKDEASIFRTIIRSQQNYAEERPSIQHGDFLGRHLPQLAAVQNTTTNELVKQFLYRYDLHWNYSIDDFETPWKIASDWITNRQIHSEFAPELGENEFLSDSAFGILDGLNCIIWS